MNTKNKLLTGILFFLSAFLIFSHAYTYAEEIIGTPKGSTESVSEPIVKFTTSVSGSSVAVLAYCTDLTGEVGAQNTVDTLLADGRFGSVTLIDGDVAQPTAQYLLQNFCAVIAMTDNSCGVPIPQNIADNAADALTGFVNGGGGAVICAFGFSHLPSGGIGFGQSIFGPGLCPLQQNTPSYNAPSGNIQLSPDPLCTQLLQGVTSPLSSAYANHVSLSSGATLCASYTNGLPFLAINAAGNVIGLNTFPADQQDNTQASYRRLISNALYAVCISGQGGECDLTPVLEALDAVEVKLDALGKLPDMIKRLTSAVAALETKLDVAARERAVMEAKLDAVGKDLASAKKERAALESKSDAMGVKLNAAVKGLDKLESKLDSGTTITQTDLAPGRGVWFPGAKKKK